MLQTLGHTYNHMRILLISAALLVGITGQGQGYEVYASFGTGAPMIRMFDEIHRDVDYTPRTYSIGYRVDVKEKWQIGPEVFLHQDRLSFGSFSPIITIIPVSENTYVPTSHFGLIMKADYIMREGRLQVSGGGGLGLSALSHVWLNYAMLPLQMNARVQYSFSRQLSAFISPKLIVYPCLNIGEWRYFSPIHHGMYGEFGLAWRFYEENF